MITQVFLMKFCDAAQYLARHRIRRGQLLGIRWNGAGGWWMLPLAGGRTLSAAFGIDQGATLSTRKGTALLEQ
jgi:hypothetical protein